MRTSSSPLESRAPGERMRVRGLVQGVGFRPTVWRIARACGLSGTVLNDSSGVLIHVFGDPAARQRFVEQLRREAPPLARIDAIERTAVADTVAPPAFSIAPSAAGEIHTGVVPDTASCSACVEESLEPGNRRYRYPFSNCTHCGPRFSIVGSVPYDRANTSMATFPLCSACQREYDDPADRRFHAQPNACPACGPHVWLEYGDGRPFQRDTDDEVIVTAGRSLQRGSILAIKGLGGFHLACDATLGEAVACLRRRKRRYHKPFALMARDPDIVRRYCRLSAAEESLLRHGAAPIVLLGIEGPSRVAPEVAPGQRTLGFMLPYTPLHHLLLRELDRPIVLTSGNLSHEPQCIGNGQARERLSPIADYLLLHNRDIVNRVDDSVVRVMDAMPRLLRRARGYAPVPLPLPGGFEKAPPLVALGGELKSTFCLVKDGQAVLSQHMGDLEDAVTYDDYCRNLELYLDLFEHAPERLVVDRHPEYLATKFGRDWAEREDLGLETVQHHHAHMASCMVENGLPLRSPAVLGVMLDGLGMGDDGTFWGGEFLLADYTGYRRLAAFRPVAMVGGIQAIREPWRNTYAHLVAALGTGRWRRDFAEAEPVRFLEGKPLAMLDAMLEKDINCPRASSCGRLFDAVAAAVGICRDEITYEGQAAMELEACLDDAVSAVADGEPAYRFSLTPAHDFHWLSCERLWPALLEDSRMQTPRRLMVARFHRGLAQAIVSTVSVLRQRCGERPVNKVVLSGGVFQNRVLFELVVRGLKETAFEVLTHRQVPANDGGLSLGQAAIGAARALQIQQ